MGQSEDGPFMPDVKKISLKGTASKITAEGYPDECYAIEYWGQCEVFSCAHHVLQDLCGDNMVKEVVTIDHDAEETMYPEVLRAWKRAGNSENTVTVAKC